MKEGEGKYLFAKTGLSYEGTYQNG